MKLYTTKIVAQYLDLSERRVRQLRDEGVLEEKAPGLYDLRSSVRRYINYLRGDEGGKADLNEERAKLTKEKRIAAAAFTFRVGHKGRDQLENILFAVDVAERIVVHRLLEVDGVQDFHLIAVFQHGLPTFKHDCTFRVL